jgi:hypothetical protein
MIAKYLICYMRDMRKGRLFCGVLISYVKPVIVVVLLCGFQYLKAQTNQIDTLGIIEKIVEEQDTMVRSDVPSSLSRKWMLLQKNPFDSLLFHQNNTRFKKELYKLLMKNGSEKLTIKRSQAVYNSLSAMDGKIIRQIEFDKVDIFAPSVTDTAYEPTSWFEKTLNSTHIDTRRKILKRYILLKPGKPLDVFLASENERMIRDLSFIMDARFVAIQIPGSSDSVDLLLLTQDMLPFGLNAEMIKSTIAELGISHQNILGYGHQFMATSYWDAKNIPHLGYRLSYGIANLAGTYTALKMEYTHKWNQESYIIDISRDFRSNIFRNAGGAMFENTALRKNIELLDTTLYDINLKYTNIDLWAGRMLQVKYHSSRMSSGLFLTGRINQYANLDRPKTSDDYLYTCQDKTLLLFSTGFTHQGFKKDNLIYTFGRTEDVPFGYLFDIVSGFEWGQFKTRPYLSAGAAYGNYFRSAGYLFGQVRFGTYLHNDLMEQGAFRIQLRYFSNIHHYNRFQYRFFANFTYLLGINRSAGEFTGVENNGGISGLTSQSMRGKNKMTLNVESVVFSPFVFLGFRFAFFGGIDLGLVISENSKTVDPRLFSGLSAGVRIRNDQLVFDTFVIKFEIYPGKPADGIARNFIVDNMPRLRLNDFFPYKPAIVNYQ